MPPIQKVSREDIIRAALDVVDAEGLEALTARRVGQELEVSTAPVYHQFTSMGDLAEEVMKEARAKLLQYTSVAYTERPFLNIGTGIGLFAKDHPKLYQALFLETNAFRKIVKGFLDELSNLMKRDQRFTAMDKKKREQLLDRMWTFTHGLASLIAVGLTRNPTKESIIEALSAVGGAVIRDALSS